MTENSSTFEIKTALAVTSGHHDRKTNTVTMKVTERMTGDVISENTQENLSYEGMVIAVRLMSEFADGFVHRKMQAIKP